MPHRRTAEHRGEVDVRKWLVRIAVGLGGLAAVTATVGALLPSGHEVGKAAEFRAAPAAVYAIISDFARYPEWRTGVTRVDLAEEPGQSLLVTESGADGVIPYRLEVRQPPSKLVLRIADPELPFAGTWTFEIFPNDSGSEVVLTERGEIKNPFFRVISKVLFSPTATIDTYLADLRKKLGE
jgi:uncharacterized protein YndB with AHSA1/START domain